LRINQFVILILLVLLVSNCGDKMVLPSVQRSIESFGANDTSYIHANPDWTASSMGYYPANPFTPVDIAIGDDEYIFVADSANNKIITVSKSGQLITHQNLNTIGPVEAPVGIAINSKLNLLIVNGSNVIYCWQQYFNNIGVDSIIVGFNAIDSSYIFSGKTALIDSITGIYPFYVDSLENSSFQGIAFGPSSDNTIFVTDNANNRILKLEMVFSSGVRLKNNYLLPVFTGIYQENIATFGSGAGTVDNPRGITTDSEGNVYFTQTGGNFLVQKLVPQNDLYVSEYEGYQDPIMDLNRFDFPADIALGLNDAIFVIERDSTELDSGRVSKFHNKGVLAGKVANLGRKGLVEARFTSPRAIAVSSDETVYIANTGKNKIERYQYSISSDDLPGDENN